MSPEVIRVRTATEADLNGVIAMERAVAEASHWVEEEYAGMLHSSVTGQTLRRCLFVAEGGSRLCGFAVGKVVITTAQAELESVVVDALWRRAGVGRALCEAVMRWCRELGAVEIELEVRAGNTAATTLYKRMGFIETGRRRAYYSAPVEDAVLMRIGLVR